MKKIKHILLSCDENIVYTNFWPTVSYHYKQLGYKVHLGFITNKDENSDIVKKLKMFGDSITLFKPHKKFNLMIQTKLLRWYMSKNFKNDIVCIKDLDQYVLNEGVWQENMITDDLIKNKKIATKGFNCYHYMRSEWPNQQHRNLGVYRFPASPTIGHGESIYNIFSNNFDNTFHDFLLEIESKTKTIHHRNRSDESVVLDLNGQNSERAKNKLIYFEWPDTIGQNTKKRISNRLNAPGYAGETRFDMDLFNKKYYECLSPQRPYNKNNLSFFLNYMKIPKNIQDFKII